MSHRWCRSRQSARDQTAPRGFSLPSSQWRLAVAAALWLREPRDTPMPVAKPSIAVLPFVDMSESRDQGYLADGISEEILNRLAQSSETCALSRAHRRFRFRDRPLDVPEIAEAARRHARARRQRPQVRRSRPRDGPAHRGIRQRARLVGNLRAHAGRPVCDPGRDCRAPSLPALKATLRREPAGPGVAREPRRLRTRAARASTSTTAADRATSSVRSLVRASLGVRSRRTRVPGQTSRRRMRCWPGRQTPRRKISRPGSGTPPFGQSISTRRLAIAHRRLADYYAEIGRRRSQPQALRTRAEAGTGRSDDPQSQGSRHLVKSGEYDAAIAIQRVLVTRDPLNGVFRQLLNVTLMADGRLDEALGEFRNDA